MISLISWSAVASNPSKLDDGSHCVAYRVEKVMFLVNSSMVVGKNCDVSAQVLPEVGGLYRIEVQIPVSSFQSGDSERDEDVRKILKSDVRPELTFRTKPLSVEQWRELFAQGAFELEGELTIGSKSFPLKVSSKYLEKDDNMEVDGTSRVLFKDFELTPPRVAAGLVVKAKPSIELNFHLLGSRILGADTIKPIRATEVVK